MVGFPLLAACARDRSIIAEYDNAVAAALIVGAARIADLPVCSAAAAADRKPDATLEGRRPAAEARICATEPDISALQSCPQRGGDRNQTNVEQGHRQAPLDMLSDAVQGPIWIHCS
jgi:hypothetical protein